jgi:hypothetical protein
VAHERRDWMKPVLLPARKVDPEVGTTLAKRGAIGTTSAGRGPVFH